MLRILFLVDTYYPAQDGVAEITRYTAEELALQNEVMVMSSWKKGLLFEEKYNNVAIERVKNKKHPHLLTISGNRRTVFKKIYEYNPDVLIIVSFNNWAYNWLLPHLDKFHCIKMLYNHGWPFMDKEEIIDRIKKIRIRKNMPYDFIRVYQAVYLVNYGKWIFKNIIKFHKVIYLHDHEQFYLLSKNKGLKNGIVIENSVQEEFFNEDGHGKDIINKQIVFLCVANFVERKNQELLIRAYKEANLTTESRLILIGSKETDYYEKLKQMCEELPKGKDILLLYGLSREEVLEWYGKADVFLLASYAEWSPVVLREAAAMKLAIVATRVGDAENISGIAIAENQKDFCEKIEQMEDDKYREECGIKNYEWAKLHCEKKQNINKLQREIDKLVEKNCNEKFDKTDLLAKE